MDDERYEITYRICCELGKVELAYDDVRMTIEGNVLDVICVPLPIAGGPTLDTFFVIDGVHHTVTYEFACDAEVLALNTRAEVLEAVNEMNINCRLTKFLVNEEGNIEVHSELPCSLSADCIAECAVEAYVFARQYLNIEYVKSLQRRPPSDEDDDVDREVAVQVRDANFLIALMESMDKAKLPDNNPAT